MGVDVIPLKAENAESVHKRFGRDAANTFLEIVEQDGEFKVNKTHVKAVGFYGMGGFGCAVSTDNGRVLKITSDESEIRAWTEILNAQRKHPRIFKGFAKVYDIEIVGDLALILREDVDPIMDRNGIADRTADWLDLDDEHRRRHMFSYERAKFYPKNAKNRRNGESLAKLYDVILEVDDLNSRHAEHTFGKSEAGDLEIMRLIVGKYVKSVSLLPESIASGMKRSLLSCVSELNFLPVDLHDGNLGWRKGKNEIIVFDVQRVDIPNAIHSKSV